MKHLWEIMINEGLEIFGYYTAGRRQTRTIVGVIDAGTGHTNSVDMGHDFTYSFDPASRRMDEMKATWHRKDD